MDFTDNEFDKLFKHFGLVSKNKNQLEQKLLDVGILHDTGQYTIETHWDTPLKVLRKTLSPMGIQVNTKYQIDRVKLNRYIEAPEKREIEIPIDILMAKIRTFDKDAKPAEIIRFVHQNKIKTIDEAVKSWLSNK